MSPPQPHHQKDSDESAKCSGRLVADPVISSNLKDTPRVKLMTACTAGASGQAALKKFTHRKRLACWRPTSDVWPVVCCHPVASFLDLLPSIVQHLHYLCWNFCSPFDAALMSLGCAISLLRYESTINIDDIDLIHLHAIQAHVQRKSGFRFR